MSISFFKKYRLCLSCGESDGGNAEGTLSCLYANGRDQKRGISGKSSLRPRVVKAEMTEQVP